MTAIGKIFVIINLLFSVVVAGFIVMVYAKSANWADATKKWQSAHAAAEASRSAVEKDLQDEKTRSADAQSKLDAEITRLKAEVANAQQAGKTVAGASEKINQDVNTERAAMMAMQSEL